VPQPPVPADPSTQQPDPDPSPQQPGDEPSPQHAGGSPNGVGRVATFSARIAALIIGIGRAALH
jgi:hypothetical protein